MSEYSGPVPLDPRRDSFSAWWRRITEKVLMPLFVLATAAVVTSAVGTWVSVARLTDKMAQHDMQFQSLRLELDSIRAGAVMRTELLETMKRVEQQMEIVMLRSRVPNGDRGGR